MPRQSAATLLLEKTRLIPFTFFFSDWMKKWSGFYIPINERGNAKPNPRRINLYTQVITPVAIYLLVQAVRDDPSSPVHVEGRPVLKP